MPQYLLLSSFFSCTTLCQNQQTIIFVIPKAISVWNSLPLDVVFAPNIYIFKKRPSLHLFSIYILFVSHLQLGTPYISASTFMSLSVYPCMHSKFIIEKKGTHYFMFLRVYVYCLYNSALLILFISAGYILHSP